MKKGVYYNPIINDIILITKSERFVGIYDKPCCIATLFWRGKSYPMAILKRPIKFYKYIGAL